MAERADRLAAAALLPVLRGADDGDRARPGALPLRARAVIFDADGVVLASPHYDAWAAATATVLAAHGRDPQELVLTHSFFLRRLTGTSRAAGAAAIAEVLGGGAELAFELATAKQQEFQVRLRRGEISVYDDALEWARVLAARGVPLTVATASANVAPLLAADPRGRPARYERPPWPLLRRLVPTVVAQRDEPSKKEVFARAATLLGAELHATWVVEDSPTAIGWARELGARCVGVARYGNEEALAAAGAEIVTSTLADARLDAMGLDEVA